MSAADDGVKFNSGSVGAIGIRVVLNVCEGIGLRRGRTLIEFYPCINCVFDGNKRHIRQ